MGLRIFIHSVRLVFGQLGAALRISAALYIISIAIAAVAFYYQAQALSTGNPTAPPWQFFVATIASCVPYLWIAVAWHRFVLLDEIPPTPVPTPPVDRIWSYVGRALQLGLLAMVFGLLFGLVTILSMLVANSAPFIAILVGLIFIAVGILATYRVAPVFPGAAIGKSISLGEAWKSTSGASGTLFLLAIISAIGSFVIDLPIEALIRLPGSPFTVLAWFAASTWVKLMIGVSIMTTIYGVYVEKRSIN